MISRLRTCNPSSPAFPSAVESVFYDLAATEAAPDRPSSSVQQGSSVFQRAKPGPITISEGLFLQILQHLSTDFPKPLQTRFIEAVLTVSTKTNSKELEGVGLARFHRGVQACLLMEELIDAAAMLFQTLESRSSGTGVSSDAFIGVLQSAAKSQFPRQLTAVLESLLEAITTSAAMKMPGVEGLHLSDACNLLFNFALVPPQ
ncbi:hypothetical protein P3T76_009868 [Phytophthora citrophthora]|uniref:Uncharacterized protein n=1 Tax=Phytophthora citrophthora TaxID=4793 RepID=A0AAD9GEL2_9STRA|nr:hypothetical protein P3T76_009868 [Phytophthora citrophthora]